MKYNYKISGLDCANCANKLERSLNNDKDIDKAIVNFSKLTVSIDTKLNEEDAINTINRIIDEVEPDAKLIMDNQDNSKDIFKINLIRVLIGILLCVFGMFLFNGITSKILIIIAYIVLLYRTTLKAIKLLTKRQMDENLLVTISCIGAYFTDNIHEGLMVIVLYEIGKILEELAINRTRRSISDLMDIKPEYANLLSNEEIVVVKPQELKIGDTILIKQGEKIPVDGIVTKGDAKLNVASLTGESKLKSVSVNDTVLSGSINNSGLFEVKVTNTYDQSVVAKILSLVETASDRKAKTETFVAKAARIYTPTVLVLAVLVAVFSPIIFKLSFNEAIYRALVFLVISCPCAIAISIPLSYFSGIGASSKAGILIKGSDYLDALGRVNEIIFDKTGTITSGEFNDYELKILDKSFDKDTIIKYLVAGEKMSDPPIAKSIINIFEDNNKIKIKDFKEITGVGIEYKIDDYLIQVGNNKLAKINDDDSIYIIIDNKVVATLKLYDKIKNGIKNDISDLLDMGISIKMFTGDREEYAKEIALKAGIDEYYSQLLPDDKYNLLEKEINKDNTCVAFVGDGINDAPSLALAHVGVSMGGIGSEAAIEASDVVIMTDEISKINECIRISKFTTKIVKENLILALGIKLLVLILSFLGIASMWQAVFADTGLTLLTIINTMRILRHKYK